MPSGAVFCSVFELYETLWGVGEQMKIKPRPRSGVPPNLHTQTHFLKLKKIFFEKKKPLTGNLWGAYGKKL